MVDGALLIHPTGYRLPVNFVGWISETPSTASDPLFDGGRTQYPDTDIVATKARTVVVARRRTRVARITVPGTTAHHAALYVRRVIIALMRTVIKPFAPVRTRPLPDIA